MKGHIYFESILSGDHIELGIISCIKSLCAHECSHFGITIDLHEPVPVLILLIVERDNVICSSSLVLLGCSVYLRLYIEPLDLLLLFMFHVIPSIQISLETFLPQIVMTHMPFINVNLSNFSIRYCKIFIETVSL